MTIGLRFEYNQAQFKALSKKLSSFERSDVLHQTLEDVGEFMRGKLRDYPAYRYVSRKAAYGQSFQSDKQRRWFFAALKRGEIPDKQPRRTGTLGEGWRILYNGPHQLDLANPVPYAKYVQGTDPHPHAAQPRMAGWKGITAWLKTVHSEIGRVGMKNLKKWVDS
jgi:hypothetical protein